MSLLPVPPLGRTVPFLVLGLSTWNGHHLELRFLRRTLALSFFSHLKTVLLAALELGAPLSSVVEGALYKCSIMNE